MKTATATAKKSAQNIQTKTEKPVEKKYEAKVYSGDNPITVELAKELLGYMETEEGGLFKIGETRVLCTNNVKNRPLYLSNVADLTQTILRKQWMFNGEPIIVSTSGRLLNGQHTLIALIFAEYERTQGVNSNHWQKTWKTPCTIEKVVVHGIEDSDEVVNTMDTCKPRSLADVIYRSNFFKNISGPARKKVSKILDYAIRNLRHRTGADKDAFSPRRTHGECLEFLGDHEKLQQCVSHVFDEDGENKSISKLIPLGNAASLLYLMGSSTSDLETYQKKPNEKSLNWENFDKAQEYFVFLAQNNSEFKPLINEFANLMSREGIPASLAEKEALIIKGWHSFLENDAIKEEDLGLNYETNLEGVTLIAEYPVVGGIDLDLSAETEILTEEDVEKTKKEFESEETEYYEPDGEESTDDEIEETPAPTPKKKVKK